MFVYVCIRTDLILTISAHWPLSDSKFSKIFARCARRQILIQILENPYLPQESNGIFASRVFEFECLLFLHFAIWRAVWR